MQTSLDMTVAYANTREQFGQPIGRFQAVRHHCANMASRVVSARLLALEALSALDRGEDAGFRAAAAKAAASRSAPEVLMLGHQVHGGNGVIEENDLYFFTLRGKERSLAWGTVEECLAVMAEDIPREVEWL
jgi:alkylation response protein AidB-like acyl-CoA dehydrogenase